MRQSAQVALVTGGTRGVGLAATHAFIRRGARVVITAAGQAPLDSACRRL